MVYDVPEPEWQRFCERFSREHRGKRLTVEMTQAPDDPDATREVLAESRPLERLRVAAAGGDRRVVVALEGHAGGKIVVPGATRLCLEQHGERARGLVRIDAADQRIVLLSFEEPLLPGILNGLP